MQAIVEADSLKFYHPKLRWALLRKRKSFLVWDENNLVPVFMHHLRKPRIYSNICLQFKIYRIKDQFEQIQSHFTSVLRPVKPPPS